MLQPFGPRAADELVIAGGRARFTLTRVLPCTPSQLWPWLTDPTLLARWSLAAVEMHEPFGEGATRVVRLRLGPIRLFSLRETITRVEHDRLFEYRGQSVREHQGSARLEPWGDGTRLIWSAAFRAPLAFAARPMALLVQEQMRASFDTLTRSL